MAKLVREEENTEAKIKVKSVTLVIIWVPKPVFFGLRFSSEPWISALQPCEGGGDRR